MTISIRVSNPAEHQPGELRAVALFLNSFASDLEEGRIQSMRATGASLVAIAAQPTGDIPAAPKDDARSASDTAPPAPVDADEDSNTSDDEFDSAKIRWDARIHSETRNQNKDGTWRLKRGADQELVKSVLAEQASSAVDKTPAEETPPAAPVEETPPTAPVVETTVKPADVIKFATGNKIPADQQLEIYSQFGLENAAGLFTQAALAGPILEAFKALVE